MPTDGTNITALSVERADPQEMAGQLMESEHRGRYWWAAQLAKGRKVLDAGCGTGYGADILAAAGAASVAGIDIAQEAVDSARKSFEGASTSFLVGDLRELPFDDHMFDLVVCFEVIEHLKEQERVIGELHRVLRAGGVLAISSPNRGVYPAGNPYHIHEYQSAEFEQALAEEFEQVELYRQSPWLAAAVLDDERSGAIGPEGEFMLRVIKNRAIAPGEETFTIALASDAELPAVAGIAMMGDPFEVGWWEERVRRVVDERDDEHAKYEQEHVEQGRALLAVEAHLADARDEIAQLLAAEADLKAWAEQIRRAAERDAARAEERHARAQQRGDDFENRLRRAERTIDDITGSLSWRLTAPLRTVKRLLQD